MNWLLAKLGLCKHLILLDRNCPYCINAESRAEKMERALRTISTMGVSTNWQTANELHDLLKSAREIATEAMGEKLPKRGWMGARSQFDTED